MTATMTPQRGVFRGSVDESGTFKPDDAAGLRERFKAFTGKRVAIIVKAHVAQRSLNQSNYWWGVPVPMLAEHCGYTPSQMHYALLGECFGYRVGPMGQPVPNKPSSSDLTTAEFSHLIEWVLTWGPTELGVNIPAPNEVIEDEA